MPLPVPQWMHRREGGVSSPRAHFSGQHNAGFNSSLLFAPLLMLQCTRIVINPQEITWKLCLPLT